MSATLMKNSDVAELGSLVLAMATVPRCHGATVPRCHGATGVVQAFVGFQRNRSGPIVLLDLTGRLATNIDGAGAPLRLQLGLNCHQLQLLTLVFCFIGFRRMDISQLVALA